MFLVPCSLFLVLGLMGSFGPEAGAEGGAGSAEGGEAESALFLVFDLLFLAVGTHSCDPNRLSPPKT